MNIHTLWGWRKGEEGPELMVAWDEYCVDENRDGYEGAKEQAMLSIGDDLHLWREIVIKVDYDAVMATFDDSHIDGEVVSDG